MKSLNIGIENYYRGFEKNRLFLSNSIQLGDDLLAPIIELKKVLESHGHRVGTTDTFKVSELDVVLFLDYPRSWGSVFKKLNKACRKYLMTFEAPHIRPANWDFERHREFQKIFTWSPELIDNQKYFACYFSVQKKTLFENFNPALKTEFCALIASQKFSWNAIELYSQRDSCQKWFQKNHVKGFSLYGVGWDYYLSPLLPPICNKIITQLYKKWKWLPRRTGNINYKGLVPAKMDVLKKSKFSICFENAVFNGYITEKIFDCFFSGCIPVYWGAPDILKYIPADCFIDMRKFKNFSELNLYLQEMTLEEHQSFLSAIWKFINSPQMELFTSQNFARVISKGMFEG